MKKNEQKERNEIKSERKKEHDVDERANDSMVEFVQPVKIQRFGTVWL